MSGLAPTYGVPPYRYLADMYPAQEVAPFLGHSEELRAQVALALGDTTAARVASRNVIAIWKDADAIVQPRAAAARSALAWLEGR